MNAGAIWRRFLELAFDAPAIEIGEGHCRSCMGVYEGVHACPNQIVGHCEDCRRSRLLDRFGNCSACASSSVTSRSFLYAVSQDELPAPLVFHRSKRRRFAK